MKRFLTLMLLVGMLAPLNGCLLAAGAAGVAGATTYAQDRTAGERVDDNGIALAINRKFLERNGKIFNGVNTHINEGRVLLTGKVDNPINRKDAEEITWQVSGVKEVMNEITLNNQESFSNYMSDAWISQQIRARLLFTENIHSVNFGIETVDRVVYIMGIAQTEQEMKWVIEIARRTKGVTKVVSHAILKNDPRRGVYADENKTSSAPATTYQEPSRASSYSSPSSGFHSGDGSEGGYTNDDGHELPL